MRTETLKWLACPTPGCAGPLSPHPSFDSRYAGRAQEELLEAVLVCSGCGSEYPVILGVALLELDLEVYLSAFWEEIESCSRELAEAGEVSRAMRSYLGIATAFTGQPGPSHPRPDMHWTTSSYLQAHFDPFSLSADLSRGWWSEAVESHREDPYSLLLGAARKRAERRPAEGLAIDVGTSVGRGAAELAALHPYSVGVDRSFRAILAARRRLLDVPGPLDTYRIETEKGRWETRSLPPRPSTRNLDFVVGSGAALPVPTGSASCIAALNVLCAVADPLAMLNDFARTLAPGGSLLLSSPFWSDAGEQGETPFATGGPEYLRTALAPHFAVEVERDEVPWVLRVAKRRWDVYLCHCVVATRR
ncbi:MAG TPA: class I SAM-dependent methyltransferase [Actinomycetota bacterium]|nr:class I SAM-dependent methyltransferase [Actinomycetota bacterium]